MSVMVPYIYPSVASQNPLQKHNGHFTYETAFIEIEIHDFRILHFYSEHVFGNWTKLTSYKTNVCIISHFKPLDLKHEMTVMPLNRVSDTLS